MARTEEIEVLRFFETGPIEKVEVVFNIVSEKMRERLRGRDGSAHKAEIRERKARRRDVNEGPPSEA
jgi:hypothetical protein